MRLVNIQEVSYTHDKYIMWESKGITGSEQKKRDEQSIIDIIAILTKINVRFR